MLINNIRPSENFSLVTLFMYFKDRYEERRLNNQKAPTPYVMASQNPDVLLSKVVNVIRAASSLAGQDVDFYKNLDREFGKVLKSKSDKLADMANEIILSIDEHHESFELKDEDISGLWNDFGNIMDNLLEMSDHSLDKLNRAVTSKPNGADLQYLGDFSEKNLSPAKRVEKPQLKFKTCLLYTSRCV